MHERIQELAGLRAQLRQLPDFTPPPAAWLAIHRRLLPMQATPPAPVRRHSPRLLAMAAAALPVIAIALLWQLQRDSAPSLATTTPGSIDALVARSQHLESLLQQLPPRPAVEHAATSATINALQARIQLLDSELSTTDESANAPADAHELWSQRVQLMNSLVGMRYAEAVRVGYQAASHEGVL
jgi:LPS O-antigen subunit length determinant protein (WzzB/FepE family)